MPIPTQCRECNGPLVKATSVASDPTIPEHVRKRIRSLRTTPMHWLSAYICKKCGRIYVYAQERDI